METTTHINIEGIKGLEWLVEPVAEHILNNSGNSNSVEIVCHFHLSACKTMRVLKHLEDQNRIKRSSVGIQYVYVSLPKNANLLEKSTLLQS
jgi:hypothetical protein